MSNRPNRGCSTDACQGTHYAKDLCTKCYQARRYKSEPAVREARLASAKAYRLAGNHADEITQRRIEWGKKNPERHATHKRNWEHRVREREGAVPGSKFRIGLRCSINVNGKSVPATVASGAYRFAGAWCVDVCRPGCEPVRLPTKEVRLKI